MTCTFQKRKQTLPGGPPSHLLLNQYLCCLMDLLRDKSLCNLSGCMGAIIEMKVDEKERQATKY